MPSRAPPMWCTTMHTLHNIRHAVCSQPYAAERDTVATVAYSSLPKHVSLENRTYVDGSASCVLGSRYYHGLSPVCQQGLVCKAGHGCGMC